MFLLNCYNFGKTIIIVVTVDCYLHLCPLVALVSTADDAMWRRNGRGDADLMGGGEGGHRTECRKK